METKEINTITVYLSDDAAQKFILFQQYYDVFNTMVEHKVFEQKGATISLHFDTLGALRNITRADVLYDSRVNFTNTN